MVLTNHEPVVQAGCELLAPTEEVLWLHLGALLRSTEILHIFTKKGTF